MLNDQHRDVLEDLSRSFAELEMAIEQPRLVKQGSGSAFRYLEETLEAAIIQKLARVISGLNSSLVLLESGFYQELAVLLRTLDEFGEDIIFLCDGLRRDRLTDLHKKYLKYFYQEEFDHPECPLTSAKKRRTVSRDKIQAYIARMPEYQLNCSDQQNILRTIAKTNSGYVHAASPQIMDMYFGNPPKFQLDGMLGSSRKQVFQDLLWDYVYRGILSTMTVSVVLKQKKILDHLFELRASFEHVSGKCNWDEPASLIKKQKAKEKRRSDKNSDN